jgi:hypothetical protein
MAPGRRRLAAVRQGAVKVIGIGKSKISSFLKKKKQKDF